MPVVEPKNRREARRNIPATTGKVVPMQILYENFMFYTGYYVSSFWFFWNNLRPMQYGMLLSAVAASGWWMMRYKRGHG